MLEQVRRRHKLFITGYVVMPEHVHLLIGEPDDGKLSAALQALKQLVAQQLGGGGQFWQPRYYDFNVWSELKRKEKLRYIHRIPVKRGLVARPEDWQWSSFRHWLTGEIGVVEVESQWTARRREQMGMPLSVTIKDDKAKPKVDDGERKLKIPTLASQGWGTLQNVLVQSISPNTIPYKAGPPVDSCR